MNKHFTLSMDRFNLSNNTIPVVIMSKVKTAIPIRKHKKRRINKKWAKRYGYRIEVQPSELDDKAYVTRDENGSTYIYCGEEAYEKLKSAIDSGNLEETLNSYINKN